MSDNQLPDLKNPLGWFALIGQFAKPPTPDDLMNKQYIRRAVHGAVAVKVIEKMPVLWGQVGPVLEYAGSLAQTAMKPLVARAKRVTTDDLGKVLGEYAASGGSIERAIQVAKTIGEEVPEHKEQVEEQEQVAE